MRRGLLVLPLLLVGVACGGGGEESDAPVVEERVPGEPVTPRRAPPPSPAAVVPDFRLRLDPSTHLVDARIELDVPRAEPVHLLFRAEWGGYPGLESRLAGLEAWGPSGALDVRMNAGDLGAGHHIVDVTEPERVTIAYRMRLQPPNESILYHRASQLGDAGGHLLGGDLLPRVWVGRPRNSAQPARIWFTGMPPSWRVASILPRAGTGYEIQDILSAVFVVGSLRTRRLSVGPHTLTAAIYGDWPVDDRRVIDATDRIAGSLHRIAGDGWAAGDYLLGAGRVPGTVPGLSTGGQVIGNSGIVYVGGAGPPEVEFRHWMYTTAHELTHWYIPTAFAFDGAPPRWFAEGFTDYFALKILLAGGLIEPEAFLGEIGARLARYRASPHFGNGSIVDAERDFWESETYRFIYDGGASAAFLLDLGFQDRGRALEGALKAVRRDSPVTSDRLVAALSDVPENGWLAGWLSEGVDPDWDARLERYELAIRDQTLIGLDDWATDALATIRP